ncbi:hypothetical protein BDV96DRAFT_232238 [Lophiotrema nucula]|uniref:Uncharacterized protein n=1 Tax=Lophiotrema nucula TaxID=690887 RepID=A0A6A5YU94_9PLEO|nr:hypothetical protein BDV96DRAFT_232238 [Lophiotrema nucula]
MQATMIPYDDHNKCWFCKEKNPSQLKTCKCGAVTTPTREDDKKLVHRIFAFGCNSRYFPSCQRLHESLLDLAVQALEDSVCVAVRVGSDSQFAIYIKDADGRVRSCAITTGSTLQLDIEQAEFLRVSRDILKSHADRTTGKASPTAQHHSL